MITRTIAKLHECNHFVLAFVTVFLFKGKHHIHAALVMTESIPQQKKIYRANGQE